MIFSTNLGQIALVSPAAARFIAEHDLATLPCGRYDLGDDDFVNVMEYTTKLRHNACYEAHQEYADIQMVIAGAEQLEVAPVSALQLTSPYDPQGDCALYDGAHTGEAFLMTPGRWCLVMPEDPHMPGVSINDAPAPVKKAVFKVLARHIEAQ